MRKIVIYCDRCKKKFESWNHKKTEVYGVAEFAYDDGDPQLDEPKDLCESCYTELENWWNYSAPQAERQAESQDAMSMSMIRESLRNHCEKMCKVLYECAPSSNAYMEHKLVLDLLETSEDVLDKINKIRAEIAEVDNKICQQFLPEDVDKEVHHAYQNCLNIIDRYKGETEPQERKE